MTQEEIIRMARETGCDNYGDCYEFIPETLERFVALVAAHEREACAKLVLDDAWALTFQTFGQYRAALAAAIRARGEK